MVGEAAEPLPKQVHRLSSLARGMPLPIHADSPLLFNPLGGSLEDPRELVPNKAVDECPFVFTQAAEQVGVMDDHPVNFTHYTGFATSGEAGMEGHLKHRVTLYCTALYRTVSLRGDILHHRGSKGPSPTWA